MKGHTPGPWTVAETGLITAIASKHKTVAEIWQAGSMRSDEDFANARLIADAPRLLEENARLNEVNAELLEALKLALDYYRSHGTQKFNPYEVEQALERAITKAEGKV